jgi:hypothetical protein
MKILKFSFSALFAVVLSITTSAQHDHTKMGSNKNLNMPQSTKTTDTKTAAFKVWGNCDESCKSRIETAVKLAGAYIANWDVKTQILKVTFDPTKNSVDSFSKNLAVVGHDTEKYRADDKVYNGLHPCCKYKRS